MLNDSSTSEPVYKNLYQRDEAPPHPGELLREDVLPLIGLSRTALAKRLGIPARTLTNVLAEKAPVTADLAMRLDALLGYGARYWLGLQMQHDVWVTQQPVTFKIIPLDRTRPAKGPARKRSAVLGYR